jgi:hypothetical protein
MTFKVEQIIHVWANKCSNVLIHCHTGSAALKFYTDKCATPSQLHTNSSPSRTEYTVNVANIYSSHNQTPVQAIQVYYSPVYIRQIDLVNSHHLLQEIFHLPEYTARGSEVMVKITFHINIFPSNRHYSCIILCKFI